MRRVVVVKNHAIRRYNERLIDRKEITSDGNAYLSQSRIKRAEEDIKRQVNIWVQKLGGTGRFPLEGGGRAVVEDYTVVTILP